MNVSSKYLQSLLNGKGRIYLFLILASLLTLLSINNILFISDNSLKKTIEQEFKTEETSFNLVVLIINLIVISLILIIVFRFLHIKPVAMSFEFFIFFIPSLIFFTALLVPYLSNDAFLFNFIPFLFTIIIYLFKQKFIFLKDLMTVIASVGISIMILLVFDISTIFLFSAFLLVYDIVSVFITKHMVFFAENIVKYNLPMTVTSYTEIEKEKAKEIIQNELEKKKIKDDEAEQLLKRIESQEKVISRLDLGSGDLVMFSVLSVVNYLINGFVGLIFSFAIGIYAVDIMLNMLMKRKAVFPALVAIIPSMFIAFFLAYLFRIFFPL
ncbi:MAG: presenilin family intramembrane aspartyl protease [Candidatus Anstonellales archaeon]